MKRAHAHALWPDDVGHCYATYTRTVARFSCVLQATALSSTGSDPNHGRNLAIGLAVPLGIIAALLLFCCCFLICGVSPPICTVWQCLQCVWSFLCTAGASGLLLLICFACQNSLPDLIKARTSSIPRAWLLHCSRHGLSWQSAPHLLQWCMHKSTCCP